MKMNEQINNIVTNIDDAVQMKVDMNESLYSTLSDKLYTNPIRAIIRELLSNAIDANIAAKTDNDVQVHFPTYSDPIFYVRDFGIGMNKDELINVFSVYGKSSKRDTNDQIGGLGLGAKTPFAYKKNGSTFTVESTKDGVKNTMFFFKNEKGIPCYKFVGEEEGFEPGTKISFYVDKEDFSAFIYESIPVFLFAQQFPDIYNGKEVWLAASNFKTWDEVKKARNLIKTDLDADINSDNIAYNIKKCIDTNMCVEMGGVNYEIDVSQVFDDYDFRTFVKNDYQFLKIYHFPIGSLTIQASREKLNYTEDTVKKLQKAIINKFIEREKNNLKKVA